MSESTLDQVLPSVQFVNAPDGNRLAILQADDWEKLIEWLEDVEDHRIIAKAKDRLLKGPQLAGALPLESVLDEL